MMIPFLISFTAPGARPAHAQRFRTLARLSAIAFRKTVRRVRTVRARAVLDRQYRRELGLLTRADDRMLADIGLTRAEVIAAVQDDRCWFGRSRAMEAAAARRDEAIQSAPTTARRSDLLPKADAPSLIPAAARIAETSNFR
jgi:uncharacterized protein YjiS (DUF1127 family)